jgi:hypothetical protein
MLMNHRITDNNTIGPFMHFARTHHALAAPEITQTIVEFINVSSHAIYNLLLKSSDRQIEYLFLMDSILTHVQGQYIASFVTNINFIMSLVFHKAKKIPDMAARNDQLTKLLRIFKKWEVLGFFPAHIMNQIADLNDLRFLVSPHFNLN